MSDELHILLIEDSKTDIELISEALKDISQSYVLETATDGETGLAVLFSNEIRPNLILLDLNLPKKSGLEVLKEIKRDASLRIIPVVILTNSRSEDDIVVAYASHCNAYVRKRLGFENLLESVLQITNFWFKCAALPKQSIAPNSALSNPPISQ
jgi:chemotaxis family two-component system response regulator Rcp1